MIPITLTNEHQVDRLLEADLGFHSKDGGHLRHAFHAFAAKFPPQLPAWFIHGLTDPGDVVFDPFLGSGTTVLEAMRLNRRAVGIDIDPLAVLISRAKTFHLDPEQVSSMGRTVIERAAVAQVNPSMLNRRVQSRFVDNKDREFVEYWFRPDTILELEALMEEIETLQEPDYRQFFLMVFSSIIVTKSGGVSMARDLAHSRPHKVADKAPKSAIDSFAKRLAKLRPALEPIDGAYDPSIEQGDVRRLSLGDNSVDLIVTSPPYANAIDYVRANKFSLVWMGKPLKDLAVLRASYIGTERHKLFDWDGFPTPVRRILQELDLKDHAKSGLLARYFWDMRQAMAEMFRVLKPDKCALVVVGTSTMRGIDVETPQSLAAIAQALGFQVRGLVERSLDRDRRMMPARWGHKGSGIEERMHSEHVMALTK